MQALPPKKKRLFNVHSNQRGGYDSRTSFIFVTTGVGGTSMPAFAETFTPEDIYQVTGAALGAYSVRGGSHD